MLLSCGLCFSFWSGLTVAYLWKPMTGNLFLDACLGSGIFWYITYGDMMAQQPIHHGPEFLPPPNNPSQE